MLLEGGRAETSVGVSVSPELVCVYFTQSSLHGNSRLRASVVVHGYVIFILSVKKSQ